MTRFAPAFTACCSTASVAIDVVTTPVTTVEGSPALTVSTVSAFHSTPMFFLMRSIRSCAVTRGPPATRLTASGAAATAAASAVNSRRDRSAMSALFSGVSRLQFKPAARAMQQQSRANDSEAYIPRAARSPSGARRSTVTATSRPPSRRCPSPHRPGEAPSGCRSNSSNQGPGGGRVARPCRHQPRAYQAVIVFAAAAGKVTRLPRCELEARRRSGRPLRRQSVQRGRLPELASRSPPARRPAGTRPGQTGSRRRNNPRRQYSSAGRGGASAVVATARW